MKSLEYSNTNPKSHCPLFTKQPLFVTEAEAETRRETEKEGQIFELSVVSALSKKKEVDVDVVFLL